MKNCLLRSFQALLVFSLAFTLTSCWNFDNPLEELGGGSGGSEGGGGSSTATYTKAADATVGDLGKLICTDGHIHADGEDAECTKDRVAKICYVGNDNGEAAPYNHGLALAMSDANGGGYCKWSTTISTVHTYNTTSSSFTTESGLQYNSYTTPDHNTSTYPAFQAAIANNGTAVPTGCSAWFLALGYQ